MPIERNTNITLFKSITMLCGTADIPKNIPEYLHYNQDFSNGEFQA
jgi:hypothetical protein